MIDKEEVVKHKAFGSVKFSRCYGSQRFYGSELQQHSYITLEISEAQLIREIGWDRSYSPRKPIVTCRMTATQFAELLTNMNAEGVPCTLEYVNGEKVEELPNVESQQEFTNRKYAEELQEMLNSYEKNIAEMSTLLEKKTLSKADKKKIRGVFPNLRSEIHSTLPFLIEEFTKQTNKVVVEAKAEMENSLTHKINTLGLRALDVQNDLGKLTK